MMERKTGLKSFIGYLLLLFVLIHSAYGLSVSGSTNGAGFAENLKGSDKDSFYSSISLSQLGVSNTIEGTADLTESHWVANKAGAYAEVGVDIQGATEPYTYSYTLTPGQGGGKTTPEVMASEDLNVPFASRVNAYAKARSGAMDAAIVSTKVTDGSLLGYHNSAWASLDKVDTSQNFDRASGSIKTDSGSFVWGSTKIPKGPASDQWAKILPETGIRTTVFGAVTNYADSASKSTESSQTQQEGHILGTLTSTATLFGAEPVIRNPKYGTEYDIQMLATMGSSPTGNLKYYVDDDRLETIQGAVDDAWSSDTINVKQGTYNENVMIDKSLTIAGYGAGNDPSQNTIVTGMGLSGSVFTIGSGTNRDLDVTLSGMTITGGSGTIDHMGNSMGGGILNYGTLSVLNSEITGNSLVGLGSGGGIFNTDGATLETGATLEMSNCKIWGNYASADGAGMNNGGTATLKNCEFYDNHAGWSSGAINNGALLTIDKCYIHDNSANIYGGAIDNTRGNIIGSLTITNSVITANRNTGWGMGGGITNHLGCTLNYDPAQVFGNSPNDVIQLPWI